MVDEKQILKSLQKDLNSRTPNVLDAAMNTPVHKMQSHDAVTAQPILLSSHRRPSLYWLFAPVMAAMIMMMAVAYGGWYQFLRVDSLVGVDVNPSIEIQVNNMDRVIAVRALNNDAVPIIGGIGYKQVKVQNVVNALMGSLYQHGYLQDAESAILITVENSDKDKAARLENELVIEVKDLVNVPSEQVYSQVLPREVMLNEADDLEVSMGVLHLAIQARKHNPSMSIEQLVQLPLNTLYYLSNNEADDDDVQVPDGDDELEKPEVDDKPTATPHSHKKSGSFTKPLPTPTPVPYYHHDDGDDDDDNEFDDDEYDDDEYDDDEFDDD